MAKTFFFFVAFSMNSFLRSVVVVFGSGGMLTDRTNEYGNDHEKKKKCSEKKLVRSSRDNMMGNGTGYSSKKSKWKMKILVNRTPRICVQNIFHFYICFFSFPFFHTWCAFKSLRRLWLLHCRRCLQATAAADFHTFVIRIRIPAHEANEVAFFMVFFFYFLFSSFSHPLFFHRIN